MLQIAGGILMLLGVGFTLLAGIGMVRLPDVFARLHAQTKPAVLGLMLLLAGAALVTDDVYVAAVCAVVMIFQIITVPVAGQMMSRSMYRAIAQDDELKLVRDDYAQHMHDDNQEAQRGL